MYRCTSAFIYGFQSVNIKITYKYYNQSIIIYTTVYQTLTKSSNIFQIWPLSGTAGTNSDDKFTILKRN